MRKFNSTAFYNYNNSDNNNTSNKNDNSVWKHSERYGAQQTGTP